MSRAGFEGFSRLSESEIQKVNVQDVRLAKTPVWNEATRRCRMEGESCAAQYKEKTGCPQGQSVFL
ncbi:MAG: hypothetical protein LBI28_00275 [Treponema sp.]|nr:hypothetical protein [Treponema sp.]